MLDGLGHIKGVVSEVGGVKWDGADFTHEIGMKGYNSTVKVFLPDYDLTTDWLPVAQSLTLGAKCYAVPREGTQVIVLPGNGIEDAVVIGAIYSKPDPPPLDPDNQMIIGMVADDGTEINER